MMEILVDVYVHIMLNSIAACIVTCSFIQAPFTAVQTCLYCSGLTIPSESLWKYEVHVPDIGAETL